MWMQMNDEIECLLLASERAAIIYNDLEHANYLLALAKRLSRYLHGDHVNAALLRMEEFFA